MAQTQAPIAGGQFLTTAVNSNDVYVTVWDYSGWERTGSGVWHQWSPAGTVL